MKYLARILGAASVVLAGCTTTASLTAKVDAKSPCCKSMSEFKYEALTASDRTAFQLNDDSPVFSFETGKSYFKAFALPSQGKLLRVASRPTGSIGFETRKFSQSFCARALFLDESFRPVIAFDSLPNYARSFGSSAFISQFEIPTNARYVVLHTNPKTYNDMAVRYTSGGGYMVGNAFVFERGGEPIYHPCGPVADASAEIL